MAREMYTEAELQLVKFDAEDVITASDEPVYDPETGDEIIGRR